MSNPGTPLTYTFRAAQTDDAELPIVALPVHPLTSASGLGLAVRIDDAPPQVQNFHTYGRSNEWKRNVLSNTAERTIPFGQWLFDRLEIRFDGAADRYGAPLLR